MLFEEAGEFAEFIRGSFPFYLIFALPIFIIISPVNPVAGAHEFPVYRMQHFDLHGVSYGSRAAGLSVEVRPLHSGSPARRCIVAQFSELSLAAFRDALPTAAGFLFTLPNVEKLPDAKKQQLAELEQALLQEEIPVPVYFARETPTLISIVEDVTKGSDGQKTTAAETLLHAISANGYQLSTSGSQAKARTDVMVANIQGKLTGYGVEEQLPTIALVAHYDSFGIAPDLSFGVDSNGSGVAVLLEIVRLFSRLYSSSRSHPRYNVLFLLSGAGKLNFQGSKRWLEDQLDATEGSLLHEAAFVLCLDSLIGPLDGNKLYLHVSKPPKEGSAGARFLADLKRSALHVDPTLQVEMVHKKINLAEESLAWEHERFSIRRLPAMTLSAWPAPRAPLRRSVMDFAPDNGKVAKASAVLAEALAGLMFNLTDTQFVFGNSTSEEAVAAWVDLLRLQPRSPQLLSDKNNALVGTLQDSLARYAKEVKVTHFTPDKRDPEFVFYDSTQTIMNVYSVKPAVFDLVLTAGIVSYLSVIYLIVQHFPSIYSIMLRMSSTSQKQKYQ